MVKLKRPSLPVYLVEQTSLMRTIFEWLVEILGYDYQVPWPPSSDMVKKPCHSPGMSLDLPTAPDSCAL